MDEICMKKALIQARKAYKLNEVPVGAVIVLDGTIIARSYNKKESTNNAVMHAEMIAISKACRKLKSWRLDNCVLYVTLEPCQMCLGAIAESRIKKIVFGAYRCCNNNKYENINVQSGIMEQECSSIIRDFFKKKRY